MSTNYNQYPAEDHVSLIQHHQNDVPLINVGFSDFPEQSDRQHIVDVHVESEKTFTWTHFVMSIIIFIVGGCICMIPLVWPFSLLGLIYSSNAYSSHGDKAYRKSQHQNKLAMIFWILAAVFMLIGFVIVVSVIFYVVSLHHSAENVIKATSQQLQNTNLDYINN